MGSGNDLKSSGVRRMIVNATYWSLGLESLISKDSSVEIVGNYEPLESGFDYKKLGVRPQPVSHYR
jgi:hypothetical protein